jgi:colicin import membrane protein
MARKLKAYQTSVGFYDLAIAAPSMKAALEAWGAGSNLFHQGFAKESEDPAVIAATMAVPGVVLRRPVGSDVTFLPDDGTAPGVTVHCDRSGLPRRTQANAPAVPAELALDRSFHWEPATGKRSCRGESSSS